MEISPETITSFLELGGQYALPAAALLRAIYAGVRGNLPEGIGQITAASVFAGLIAVVDPAARLTGESRCMNSQPIRCFWRAC